MGILRGFILFGLKLATPISAPFISKNTKYSLANQSDYGVDVSVDMTPLLKDVEYDRPDHIMMEHIDSTGLRGFLRYELSHWFTPNVKLPQLPYGQIVVVNYKITEFYERDGKTRFPETAVFSTEIRTGRCCYIYGLCTLL